MAGPVRLSHRRRFPELHLATGTVALRPWAPADAGALAQAWADSAIARWTAVPADPTLRAARDWIGGEATRRDRGVALDLVMGAAADPGVVRGELGVGPIEWGRGRAAVGFWVSAQARGQGLASAGMGLLADWWDEAIGLELVAATDRANPEAGAVLAANHFELVRTRGSRQAWRRRRIAPV